MSNLDAQPVATPCHSDAAPGPVATLLSPREVPLGGIRGLKVERALPQKVLPTVGAWCFLDQFGPAREPMRVLPHPHVGLQTVTWPLVGRIHHRDSLGNDEEVRPGQLNLMTSGRGIAHSEVSLDPGLIHGLQLWVALPAHAADIEPAFEHVPSLPRFVGPGVEATILAGRLGDMESPATVHTPLVGADLSVHGRAGIPVRPDFEHALLVISETVDVAGTTVSPGTLLYLGTGRDELILSTSDARVILLGGEPFPDDLVMWWNFVGRSHDEIVAARADWEDRRSERFGTVAGHGGVRVPAPALPTVRLTPRRRRSSAR